MDREIPSPPAGKTGWPWVEATEIRETELGTVDWPRITVVTPSYNQGQFLEATIRSILLQGYPNLEYMICQRIGSSPIETKGFGRHSVSSFKRVPRPPHRITTGGLVLPRSFLLLILSFHCDSILFFLRDRVARKRACQSRLPKGKISLA